MNEIQEITERQLRLAAQRIIDIVRELDIEKALEDEAVRILKERKTYSCQEAQEEV